MNEHYPRIRVCSESGSLLIRDGLSFCFYMHRAHQDVASAAMKSLEVYMRVAGPALGLYADMEGEWQKLDEAGWEAVRREMFDYPWGNMILADVSGRENRYFVEYSGRPPADPSYVDSDRWGCALCFWLPTEYLEEHGPGSVRELAMELAAPLPLSSGQAGLSFNVQYVMGVDEILRKLCFRYPGMDMPDAGWAALKLGNRVRGPCWLNFLGQPLLGELGGVAGIRSRLCSNATTVQEMEGDRVVITLGKWPEAGDTEQGRMLPAYRELARVLEPWLYHEDHVFSFDFPPEVRLRWERRFLD